MKKILTIVILLMALAAIAVAVFVATFNADQYRPLVVKQLESLLGKPVQIERVGLTWTNGIAFELKRLEVYEGTEPSGNPFLSLESASAVLEMMPLLNRQLSIGAVILKRPNIQLIVGFDGKLRGFESMGKKKTSSSAAPALSLLLIRRIQVEDGVIRYRNESAGQPTEIDLRRVDLSINDLKLNAPFPFKIDAALFADEQNLEIRGNIRINSSEGVVSLEKINIKSDLGSLRSPELINAIPGMAAGNLDGVGGNLEINIGLLKLSNDWLRDLQMEVRLYKGWIKPANLSSSIEAIQGQAQIGSSEATLENFSAQFAGGKIEASANLRNLSAPQPASSFKAGLRGLNLAELSKPKSPAEPFFEGLLSFDFEGYTIGLKEPSFSQSLTGQGQIQIQDPVLRNVNFVREVFEKLSLLPGAVQTLEKRLPPSYREKLQERDTRFAPISIPIAVRSGFFMFDQFVAATDVFELSGRGQMNFDGMIGAQAMLRLDADMSKAFIGSLQELQYLADREGRLEIPLTIQGPVSDLKIFPNLQVIGSRLAISKTQELIGDWLGNKNQQPVPAGTTQSGQPSTTQKATSPTAQDILSLFLGSPQQSPQKSSSQTTNQ